MIKQIKIEKLYGRFTYSFQTKPEGVTIITGPNGYGKSTILKIINALSKGDIIFFSHLEFSKIEITFDDFKTELQKKEDRLFVDGISLPLVDEDLINFYSRNPRLRRMAHSDYVDNDKELTDEELMYLLYTNETRYLNNEFNGAKQTQIKKFFERLLKIEEQCGEVEYISEQRLFKTETKRDDSKVVVDVIKDLPKQLIDTILQVSEEYSKVANSLDSTYPKRLLAAKDGIKDASEYLERLKDANEKFEKLNKYNLVTMTLINEEVYKPEYSTALKIYFDDFAQKYKVFEELITKLELFTRIINSRLTFKELKISRNNGFEIIDSENNAKSLRLSDLSSGEKQEIVLFYNLIFTTKKNILLLIDEPEISLHILWQKSFLNDLLDVASLSSLQVIVATHSPQIISNHWDIQIDLGELYGQELD